MTRPLRCAICQGACECPEPDHCWLNQAPKGATGEHVPWGPRLDWRGIIIINFILIGIFYVGGKVLHWLWG